jgi:hypothetical protein
VSKLLLRRIALFLLWAAIGSFAVRLVFRGSDHLEAATIERPWTPTRVGMNGFGLDAPWKLESLSLPFPASLAGTLRDPAVHYGHIEDAGGVMASRFPIARGVRADLDGAATGMVEQMRKTPGTLRIDSRQRETTLLGERAIEVTSRIHREKGKPLRAVGIVALVDGDLVQVSVMTLDDEPLADELWKRVRDSIRRE